LSKDFRVICVLRYLRETGLDGPRRWPGLAPMVLCGIIEFRKLYSWRICL